MIWRGSKNFRVDVLHMTIETGDRDEQFADFAEPDVNVRLSQRCRAILFRPRRNQLPSTNWKLTLDFMLAGNYVRSC